MSIPNWLRVGPHGNYALCIMNYALKLKAFYLVYSHGAVLRVAYYVEHEVAFCC